jgi:hypothetical protein
MSIIEMKEINYWQQLPVFKHYFLNGECKIPKFGKFEVNFLEDGSDICCWHAA